MRDDERKLLVLIIEDQPSHLKIIQRVLTESATPCEWTVLGTADQGLDYLYRRGLYASTPEAQTNTQPGPIARRPDFILLDMHIADGKGQSLLSAVKSDISLRRIPIIVLSHLTDSDAILASYQQQCNCYVIKPSDLNHLNDVVRAIESFWFNIVTLPTQ